MEALSRQSEAEQLLPTPSASFEQHGAEGEWHAGYCCERLGGLIRLPPAAPQWVTKWWHLRAFSQHSQPCRHPCPTRSLRQQPRHLLHGALVSSVRVNKQAADRMLCCCMPRPLSVTGVLCAPRYKRRCPCVLFGQNVELLAEEGAGSG